MSLLSVQRGKATQRAVKELYLSAGCEVISFSMPGLPRGKRGRRGTMQTAGVPDFMVLAPPRVFGSVERRDLFWFHEAKGGRGRLTEAQERLIDRLWLRQVRVIVGGLDEAIAWLRELGLVAR